MNKQLESLIEIQKIDRKIKAQEDILRKIPLEIDELYSSCESAKKELQKAKDDIKADNKKKRDTEQEVESEKEHIVKTKKKLTDVKNNKEYSAILSEIESTKKKIDKIEDMELELMEIIEEKNKILQVKEEQLKEEEKKFSELKKESGIEQLRHQTELTEKRKSHKELTESFDPDWLKHYNAVSEVGDGIAVVQLSDDICQGCYTGIPPQLAIQVRKGEEVIYCPHCDRILYKDDKKTK